MLAARSARAPGQRLAPLVLVEAAPDAVRLPDHEGVVAALLQHGATAADRLGGPFALQPLLLTLDSVGSEEEVGLWTLAGRTVLPAHLQVPWPGHDGFLGS